MHAIDDHLEVRPVEETLDGLKIEHLFHEAHVLSHVSDHFDDKDGF